MTTIVPVTCVRCGVPIDLQVVDWDPTVPATERSYRCPDCKEPHQVALHGQIVLVVRRIVPRLPVRD